MKQDFQPVGECSESQILQAVLPSLPCGSNTVVGPGDDCAVVNSAGQYVVTSDILVENQHFRLDWSTGSEIGWRAAMQNLADIAAMGAKPVAMEVALVLPRETPLQWVEDFGMGLGQALSGTNCGVVGGDLSSGEVIVIGVTVQGECWQGITPVLRSGARPGDVVAVAGTLGRSIAGFYALSTGVFSPELHGSEVPAPFTEVVQVFRTPTPPLAAGVLAAQNRVTAMMDVSDGLLLDAIRLAKAAGVRIDFSSVLLEPDVRALRPVAKALHQDPLQWVLSGGEDHALLATFPSAAALDDCLLPAGFRPIGRVLEASQGQELVTVDNRVADKDNLPTGWQHFGN